MPTYSYKCSSCSHRFEAIQKISDVEIKKCPKCKGNKVQRLITSGNFQLKGEGWFKNSGSY